MSENIFNLHLIFLFERRNYKPKTFKMNIYSPKLAFPSMTSKGLAFPLIQGDLVVLKEREVSLKNVVVAVAVLNFYVLH
jgi:hypothetical protein